MEERIIVESVAYDNKKRTKWMKISVIFCILIIIVGLWINNFRFDFYYRDLYEDWGWTYYRAKGFYDTLYHLTLICSAMAIISGIMFICNVILVIMTSNIKIVVTNVRVYGTIRNKQVDLPIDSISAVSSYNLFGFKGISVSTPSGLIKFLGLENRDELHKEISKLISERQKNPVVKMESVNEKNDSTADELKKYKELLDSGIITQEEFDAKKKQLLGL